MINSKEELPVKWMVRITKENINILNEYRYKHYCKDNNLQKFNFMTKGGSGHDEEFGYVEITFEEFKKYVLGIQEEQFPEDDFGVVIENNNGREIIEYLISKGFKNTASLKGSMFDGRYSILKGMNCITSNPNPVSKIYTLQQLKNLENNMETKKIIGYKAPYYIGTAKPIQKGDVLKPHMGGYILSDCNWLPKEIVETWEPVYAQQEKIIDMGSFNLTIKPEGIFHNSENITDFVQGISANLGKFIANKRYGKLGKEYDFTVKDVIVSKTGCQNSETKLSQWLAVWEEYIKIKY